MNARPLIEEPLSREERKARTRRRIIDAALELLVDRGFSDLSLREVARKAGIAPNAFYRHFESTEALGLVLIDESFRVLRDMLRTARADTDTAIRVIPQSIDALDASVQERRNHWRFIAHERNSGLAVLRYAIATEIKLITSELATDLARLPEFNAWTAEDLNIIAGMIVGSMVEIADAFGETDDPEKRAEIRARANKQLRMMVVGVAGWRGSGVARDDAARNT